MMLLEVLECHGTLLSVTTLLAILAIFSFTKKPHPRLPPSPFALPIIGHLHLLGPLIHHSFHELSSRYGPLIHLRLGSVPCLVASSPDLAKELLITNELTFSTRDRSSAIEHLTYNGSAFAFASYGPYWRFIKKLCTTELVGFRTLNGFLPLRTKEYHRFLRLVMDKSKAGQPVNVTEELLKLTNSIICQMMLSIRCSDTEGQAEEARSIVRDVTRIFGEFNVSDFIWFCKNFDLQGFRRRSEDILRRYDALLGKIIKDRQEVRGKRKRDVKTCKVAGEEDVKDFLDSLLDVMEDENSEIKITTDHIKALVLDFFTAGTDTTAIIVEWALAELINNPIVLQKARDEIEQVVGMGRLVEESDNPNLPYIQAIVKETFRLHPPVPVISRKSINPCTVSGYDIPENTLLFVNIWSIGRNPKFWTDPLKFKPERFLESPGGEDGRVGSVVDVKGQHFQLLPFGTGRRGCPGMNFAMQELSTILAATIQCFELKVVVGRNGEGNGDGKVVDMSERSGLTAPRVHDLVCVPVARVSAYILDQ